MWKIRKKSLIVSLVFIMSIVGIIGTSVLPTFAQEKVINILVGPYGDAIPFKAAIPEFEAQTGFKVKIDLLPAEFYGKIMTELVTGAGKYDLIESVPLWRGDLIGSGFILNLNELFEKYEIDTSDYTEGIRALNMWDGDWYSVPYDNDVLILYYRKDLFNVPLIKEAFQSKYGYELQPPETWEQVMDMAEFFDERPEVDTGIDLLSKRVWYMASYWATNIYVPYGGEFFDEEGRVVLAEEPFVKACEVWLKLIEHAPTGVTTHEWTDAWKSIGLGQTAMTFQWATNAFRVPEQTPMWHLIGYALMPGVKQADGSIFRTPGLCYGKNLFIPKNAGHPEEAFQLAMLVSSTKYQIIGAQAGSGVEPNRYSALNDPAVIDLYGDMVPVIEESLKIGRSDISVPDSNEYYQTLAAELSAVWSGTITPKKAYQRVLDAWREIAQR